MLTFYKGDVYGKSQYLVTSENEIAKVTVLIDLFPQISKVGIS